MEEKSETKHLKQKIKDENKEKNELIQKLRNKYNKEPIKADVYTLSKLKIALDDLLVECANVLDYKQNNLYVDVQNIIGIISTLIACGTVYLSMYFKFDTVKFYLKILCSLYFIINFTSYIIYYLFGKLLRFKDFSFKTKVSKNEIYEIIMKNNNSEIKGKYVKSIYDLFNEEGEMDHNLFIDGIYELLSENKK